MMPAAGKKPPCANLTCPNEAAVLVTVRVRQGQLRIAICKSCMASLDAPLECAGCHHPWDGHKNPQGRYDGCFCGCKETPVKAASA